ncbi:hypothetical protein ACX31A_07590 [Dermacoccus nishinomiyaensis]
MLKLCPQPFNVLRRVRQGVANRAVLVIRGEDAAQAFSLVAVEGEGLLKVLAVLPT